jgi:MHS family proline/betaine transporter-like MFS transporter
LSPGVRPRRQASGDAGSVNDLTLAVLALAIFALVTLSPAAAVAGMVVLGAVLGVITSVVMVTASEVFPVPIRASGFGISFTVAGAVVGGVAPLLATLLVQGTGSPLAPAALLAAIALIGLAAGLALRDRSRLEPADADHAPTRATPSERPT